MLKLIDNQCKKYLFDNRDKHVIIKSNCVGDLIDGFAKITFYWFVPDSSEF